MCTARAGRWAGETICLEKRFQCDNYVQCEDARDEDNCEEEYLNRGIFTHNDRFLCPSPYLEVLPNTSKTWKFFPMRAIRFARPSSTFLLIMMMDTQNQNHHNHVINGIRCDGTKQCPRGEDEEECQVDPVTRFLLSENFTIDVIFLFFIVAIINLITF